MFVDFLIIKFHLSLFSNCLNKLNNLFLIILIALRQIIIIRFNKIVGILSIENIIISIILVSLLLYFLYK